MLLYYFPTIVLKNPIDLLSMNTGRKSNIPDVNFYIQPEYLETFSSFLLNKLKILLLDYIDRFTIDRKIVVPFKTVNYEISRTACLVQAVQNMIIVEEDVITIRFKLIDFKGIPIRTCLRVIEYGNDAQEATPIFRALFTQVRNSVDSITQEYERVVLKSNT